MTKETYAKRRLELMRRMGGGVAIIPTGKEVDRTLGVPYPFRAASDAIYLGFDQPNAMIVLFDGKSILFCEEKNPEAKIRTGEVPGTEGAVSEFNFDEAYPIEKLDEKMLEFLEGQKRIFLPYASAPLVARVFGWIEAIDTSPKPHHVSFKPDVRDVCKLIAEMRLIKDAEEIEIMRQVAQISAEAHIRAMEFCNIGMFECTIKAEIIHEMTRSGLQNVAYPSIVAGGKNACVLHYTDNDELLQYGDLLLIDAGAEFCGYAADITRTFPVNGKFTEPQQLLYQLVLDAQLAVIAQVRPGTPWNVLQDTAVFVLTEGLVKLGLLKGDVKRLIEEGAYKPFFPHKIGHWLGLDVHDVGDYKDENDEWVLLKPGMVLTVEPGLYVQPDNINVDEKWRGIGIRIEDDILVTEDGCEVLSAAAPKTIDDIETLMRG
ncbi:MAG: aminopeptidase P N-terminal domain-containing protein [Parcubacteria group bacterium]|nr:aminopeptidase P N-terminal domain-containing protein [Parcubacteria group bacterium]